MDSIWFIMNEFDGPGAARKSEIMRSHHFVLHTSYFIIPKYMVIGVSIIAQLSVHSCAEQSS
jgi:hypothetical protein